MRLLIDTCAFLWATSGDHRLSLNAANLILNDENEVFLSTGSVLEMAIKAAVGKLIIPRPLDEFINRELQQLDAALLPINLRHLEAYLGLPFYSDHKDPYDRLLIAQARVENLTILTSDAAFAKYEVVVRW